VLNAAKFVYGFPLPAEGLADSVSHPLDIDMLAELTTVVATATAAFDAFDHAKALEVTEKFFWTFCDDYLELVKERVYSTDSPERQASAVTALRTALEVMLRLFAPFIPFATEEVWSWTHTGSVHITHWPTAPTEAQPTGLLALVGEALIGIRRAKTDAKASQKADVTSATIGGPALLQLALDDLRDVGRIGSIEFVEAPEITVSEVMIAPTREEN
jgi:valyl-tRNA synthetase